MESKEQSKSNDNEKVENKMTIDQVLTNLKVISQIKKGEKIVTDNIILEIDNRYFQSVRRWWNQSSRLSTLDFFQKIIARSFELIDDTYNNKEKEQYYFSEENSRILQRFSLEMSNACIGLTNLKETYENDVTTKSQLDIMIGHLNNRIEKIQKVLTIHGADPKKRD